MRNLQTNHKVLVLGIDGMDPRLTRKYVDAGLMPNVAEYIKRGACREDLVLLGSVPTVTPPQWTTLCTGAYPMTHGITEFYGQHPTKIDTTIYNLDSSRCQAEQVWNCFAEAGKKTLVWHWPGSAWPPSSDSPNLHVVDGSSPGTVNQARGQKDTEFMLGASKDIKAVTFATDVNEDAYNPCVITDLEANDAGDGFSDYIAECYTATEMHNVTYDMSETQFGTVAAGGINVCQSPLKDPANWDNAPEGAKEFTLLYSKGLVRRPCLALKNEDGIYDRVAIYKNKKEAEPIVVLPKGVFVRDVVDEAIKKDEKFICNRDMKLIDIAEDGSKLNMYVSNAMDTQFDGVWSPKSLHELITSKIGFPPPAYMLDGTHEETVKVMLEGWYHIADWQKDSLKYLIENGDYEAIFSHYHNVDIQQHKLIDFLSEERGINKLPVSFYEDAIAEVYKQADYYLGAFLPYLDQGWTIMIVSDHGLVGSEHIPAHIGDMCGINVGVMKELGYTVMKKDENGNELREIDWTKTRAVQNQGTSIYINLKGRFETGIVDPADKYELEEQIMTDLYGYRHPTTGKRVVAMALRNRDARLLGCGGPRSGDIICWTAEGYNYPHTDALSTCYGMSDTSASPIFIAAGDGIKEGYYTERCIREVDVAPTAAVLGGVRMPKTCEGAPVYQIFEEEF